MRVFCLESSQPNDPCHNRVSPGSVRPQNFARPAAIVKDGASRSIVANFLDDLKKAERRGHSA